MIGPRHNYTLNREPADQAEPVNGQDIRIYQLERTVRELQHELGRTQGALKAAAKVLMPYADAKNRGHT
jgi:hypothetical protein